MSKEVIRSAAAAAALIGTVLLIGNLVVSYGHRQWKGFGRYTVIKIGQGIEVESIDPTSRLGTRLLIPNDMEINTLKQRGAWRPRSLVILGKKFGWNWVGDSVADYLGISYTSVWRKTGIWDRLAWWGLARQTKWRVVDMKQANLLTESQTADNQLILGVSEKWQEKARDLFYATDLGSSGLEIRVWNSTQEPGLAGRAAAVLESSGLAVIQVGERSSDTQDCEVVTSKANSASRVVEWIGETLNCSWREDVQLGNLVEIYLGQGFASRYKAD